MAATEAFGLQLGETSFFAPLAAPIADSTPFPNPRPHKYFSSSQQGFLLQDQRFSM
jgi:hypothetical protein